MANLCEGLMVMEPDYAIAPNLAESVENVDGKTYIYQLRDSVTFWDGSPIPPRTWSSAEPAPGPG